VQTFQFSEILKPVESFQKVTCLSRHHRMFITGNRSY